MVAVYNGNLVKGPLAYGAELPQKRVRPAGALHVQVRRNRYAGERNQTRDPGRRNGYAAETGTRTHPDGGDLRPAQKRVRFGRGFRRNGYAGAVQGASCALGRELVSAWITAWQCSYPPFLGGNRRSSAPGGQGSRRIGYALRGLACGEACGRWQLSPQNPVRAGRRYRFGWSQIRVRPVAESGTDRRRIGFAGRCFPLTNQRGWLHVYGLQVVNPYRYRLLVADGWRTVDNPAGLPTVRHHATSH